MVTKDEAMAADGCSAEAGLAVRRKLPKKRKWKSVQWLCFGLALIPIVSFAVFSGVPVVLSFISMFTNMENNDLSTMEWNSFQNFIEVFHDERFWRSWKTTFWLASAQLVTLVIALIISVLLEQKVKGAKAMQVLFFIPYICSAVAVAIMWQWVFSKDFGVLNAIFGTNIDWLNDAEHPSRLVWCVYITTVWSAPAYGIVMFKAALKNVNPSLYEAASLDGANGFDRFWYVTLPAIKQVTLFLLLASITGGLAVFDAVTVLAPLSWTGVAGPGDIGLTVNYYIYIKGVQQSEMEYAAVMSWVLFIVTFAISFFVIRARNKAAEE
ncbi:MAG TPA: sugar ABC transporter permease [Candidatus Borkfalkia avistercoris]|uniref:Sugar ABC transporter permease n=1 Tax=Candidatus Borkfalkia avistercoris TaxID=2838504 RepID=A0A9D2CZY6_9FIRM|nr:sugar ABC transporter permease [Candidatus Borkfalkia avistercoris]